MPGNSQGSGGSRALFFQTALDDDGPLATHLSLYTYHHVANCCTNKVKEAAHPSPLRKETLGNTKELERKSVCLLFFSLA